MRRIVPHYQAAAPGTGHVSSGGVIVLGVTERKGDGSFIAHGIPKAGKVLDDFWNAAFSEDKVPARFMKDADAAVKTVGGKDIVVIRVPWADRFTSQPGDWSGNVFDFYYKVYNKLKAALKVPFALDDNMRRIDDTPAHKDQGDIVEVDLDPTKGHEPAKKRPALVVSSYDFNISNSMTIVCPISSREKDFFLHERLPESCDVEGSVIMEQVRAIDLEARPTRKIGTLDLEALDKILVCLRSFF